MQAVGNRNVAGKAGFRRVSCEGGGTVSSVASTVGSDGQSLARGGRTAQWC